MARIKYTILLLTFSLLFFHCEDRSSGEVEPEATVVEKDRKEVLLIGTFHYNNPGADVAKTKSFDILNETSQNELDFMAARIAEFRPTKIFVEWDYDEQAQLDSLYNLYKQDTYFKDSLSDFYRKNEIFQLAFRTARIGEVEEIVGIDYSTEFPFDSLMVVLAQNKQQEIQSEIEKMIEVFTSSFDDRIEKGESLLNLTYYLNSDELREMSNRFHTEIPLQVGPKDNFIGPYLTSEWYRRNLYMWSLVQKGVDDADTRILILAGASHAALFKEFIDDHSQWSVVELKSVIGDETGP